MATTLRPRAQELLYECAMHITADNRRRNDIDLFSLNHEFQNHVEAAMIDYLTRMVEEMSETRLTVRRAETYLFSGQKEDRCLYLVQCDFFTPEGTVGQLTRDMVLVKLSPHCNGLQVGAKRANWATPK